MAKAAKKVIKKAATKATPSAAPKKAIPAKKAALKKTAAAPKKATAAKKAAPKKVKRKPNAAFMAPLNVSPALADIIGKKPMPRTEIIKKIWDYIKKNNLQDKVNRRMINADEKLGGIFDGKKQISMFELAKVVNGQIVK